MTEGCGVRAVTAGLSTGRLRDGYSAPRLSTARNKISMRGAWRRYFGFGTDGKMLFHNRILSHPEPFTLRYSQNFVAFRAKVDISFAKDALQPAAQNPKKHFAAMRTDRIYLIRFFDGQHDQDLLVHFSQLTFKSWDRPPGAEKAG